MTQRQRLSVVAWWGRPGRQVARRPWDGVGIGHMDADGRTDGARAPRRPGGAASSQRAANGWGRREGGRGMWTCVMASWSRRSGAACACFRLISDEWTRTELLSGVAADRALVGRRAYVLATRTPAFVKRLENGDWGESHRGDGYSSSPPTAYTSHGNDPAACGQGCSRDENNRKRLENGITNFTNKQ